MNKDSMKLCVCKDCDCHYVQNDCECNVKMHYEFEGTIHWIKKGE
jgi:hypothetical protein